MGKKLSLFSYAKWGAEKAIQSSLDYVKFTVIPKYLGKAISPLTKSLSNRLFNKSTPAAKAYAEQVIYKTAAALPSAVADVTSLTLTASSEVTLGALPGLAYTTYDMICNPENGTKQILFALPRAIHEYNNYAFLNGATNAGDYVSTPGNDFEIDENYEIEQSLKF